MLPRISIAGAEQRPFISVATALIIGLSLYPKAMSRRVELLVPDDLLQIELFDNAIGTIVGLDVGCSDG